MRILAVLNRDGGTLRSTDLDGFSKMVVATLGGAGFEVDVETVAGAEIETALAKAARSRSIDIVMAGGGDGTISAAAAALCGRRQALAILPAGTMNLFARGLGIPMNIEEAVRAFADGHMRKVDLASANGKVFVHQFSVGLHPKLVHLREKMAYGSRWGKIRASVQAAYQTMKTPPRMRVELELPDARIGVTASSIGVSNNLFGEGHLPYAEMPDRGELGVYVSRASRLPNVVRFAAHMAAGRWQGNPEVEIHRGATVKLRLKPGRLKCSIDGELCPLEAVTELKSLPGALNVWLPRAG